ncbi:hypothetical protein [Scytonema hofmannii]|uniref:hypothetical protein n=1 Tax=Scytonema hofmannii TaxID=34078 RepID=UPI00234FA8FE|nr:hypothetical protein [Scytonema hofmannii]
MRRASALPTNDLNSTRVADAIDSATLTAIDVAAVKFLDKFGIERLYFMSRRRSDSTRGLAAKRGLARRPNRFARIVASSDDAAASDSTSGVTHSGSNILCKLRGKPADSSDPKIMSIWRLGVVKSISY